MFPSQLVIGDHDEQSEPGARPRPDARVLEAQMSILRLWR